MGTKFFGNAVFKSKNFTQTIFRLENNIFYMFLKALALVFMFLIRVLFPKNLSLIQVIHKPCGNTVVKLVCTFEKFDFKHRKAALDLHFLKTCEEIKVTPKFLQFRVANDSLRQSQTYQACKKTVAARRN